MKREGIYITYALQDGKVVSIDEVESGVACNCVCPACHQKFIARKGEFITPHFAHYPKGDCENGYETSLYLMAKRILEDTGSIILPSVTLGNCNPVCLDESRNIKIKNVHLEQTADDIPIDIIIEDIEGNKYCLKMRVSRDIDKNDLSKIQKYELNTLEYDLSKIGKSYHIFRDDLAEILFDDNCPPKWIYHPKLERAKKVYGIHVDKLFCDKFMFVADPSPIYCLLHCEHGLGISKDNQTVYCKNAPQVKLPMRNRLRNKTNLRKWTVT